MTLTKIILKRSLNLPQKITITKFLHLSRLQRKHLNLKLFLKVNLKWTHIGRGEAQRVCSRGVTPIHKGQSCLSYRLEVKKRFSYLLVCSVDSWCFCSTVLEWVYYLGDIKLSPKTASWYLLVALFWKFPTSLSVLFIWESPEGMNLHRRNAEGVLT